MNRVVLIAASVVIVLGSATAGHTQQASSPAVVPVITYDDFMKLGVDQRLGRLQEVTAENKAMIYRTHAQRWLDVNHARLSASEVAVFKELIALITPERYRQRPSAVMDKQEEALRAKLRCRVSTDDVMQAMGVLRGATASQPTKRWTYLSQARCWLVWMAEEVVEYLPTPQRDPARQD